MKCRAVRTAINPKHSYASLLEIYQKVLNFGESIKLDVRTRFDSTVDMLGSVLRNKHVLQRMQDEERRTPESWTSQFHFSADEFELMSHITHILHPIRNVTKPFLNVSLGSVMLCLA